MSVIEYEKKISKICSKNGLYSNYFDGESRAEKPCGYCHYEQHRGFISKDLLKSHQCVEKGCVYFSKYCDSPYFVDKHYKVMEKKLKKSNSTEKICLSCSCCGICVQQSGKDKVVDTIHKLRGSGWLIGQDSAFCSKCCRGKGGK